MIHFDTILYSILLFVLCFVCHQVCQKFYCTDCNSQSLLLFTVIPLQTSIFAHFLHHFCKYNHNFDTNWISFDISNKGKVYFSKLFFLSCIRSNKSDITFSGSIHPNISVLYFQPLPTSLTADKSDQFRLFATTPLSKYQTTATVHHLQVLLSNSIPHISHHTANKPHLHLCSASGLIAEQIPSNILK